MLNCNVALIFKDHPITTYEVTEFVLSRDNVSIRSVVLHVQINEYAHTIDCLCALFYFKGIVCRHMLAAMNLHGMHAIPDSYIMRRWRKDIRRKHTLVACLRDDRQRNPRMQRYESIMKDVDSIAQLASYSEEKTNWFKTYLKKGKEKIAGAISTITFGILNPHTRPKRGRPPTNRLKSNLEKYSKSKVCYLILFSYWNFDITLNFNYITGQGKGERKRSQCA